MTRTLIEGGAPSRIGEPRQDEPVRKSPKKHQRRLEVPDGTTKRRAEHERPVTKEAALRRDPPRSPGVTARSGVTLLAELDKAKTPAKLIELDAAHFEEAAALGRLAFPYLDPTASFRAGIHPTKENLAAVDAEDPRRPRNMRYWLAIDHETGQVIGTTGLYSYPDDPKALWLGWMCVDPDHRGKGIGRQLLDFSLAQAREEGATHLRLYTSNHPNEAAAQLLYESRGMTTYKTVPLDGTPWTLFYRETELR
jgi:GNAT superfamily N-acetyltransferase